MDNIWGKLTTGEVRDTFAGTYVDRDTAGWNAEYVDEMYRDGVKDFDEWLSEHERLLIVEAMHRVRALASKKSEDSQYTSSMMDVLLVLNTLAGER